MTSFLERAGRWFLHSGIQESSGGVARYYRSYLNQNAPVSSEITGYAVSTLVYLYELGMGDEYRDAALRSARYLTREAWDPQSHTFPFEPKSPHAYFFDLGIIARGLLAASRLTGDDELRGRAQDAALSLAFDFMGEGGFYPVISLPDKQPLAYEPRWSRSPGCYQLKSALAWREIGDPHAERAFEAALQSSIAKHASFPAGDGDREKIMDRLHAYCYFLEGLLSVAERPEVREALADGIDRTGTLLREIAPEFERSDVCAQLLRVRLVAHHLGAVALDERAACEEADRAASYQADSTDQRLNGGFWFGRKGDRVLPYSNPVSTAFCLQALALWHAHRSGAWSFQLQQLI